MGIYNQVVGEAVALALLCGVAAVFLKGRVEWPWVFGAIGLFLVQKAVLFLGVAGSLPDLVGGRYNWEGKLAAFLLLLVVGLTLFRDERNEWGWTLRQDGPAGRRGVRVAVGVALATAAFEYLYFPGTKSEPVADWLYQLAMPSLHEELLYRGLLLFMLMKAFAVPKKVLGAPLGWAAVVVTVQFYLTHILQVTPDAQVSLYWADFISLIYGGLWVYVRVATGSLLLPILLHAWANTAGYLL